MPRITGSIVELLILCTLFLDSSLAIGQETKPAGRAGNGNLSREMPKGTLTLDEVLKHWAKGRDDILTLHCEGVHAVYGSVLRSQKEHHRFEGWYVKPSFVRFDWRDDDGKPMMIVVTNRNSVSLYGFRPQIELSFTLGRVNKAPPNGLFARLGWLMNGGAVEALHDITEMFVLGVMPKDFERQFDTNLTGEDRERVYVALKPNRNSWMFGVYSKLIVSVDKDNWHIRAVGFYEPDGNQIRFDVTKIERNTQPRITPESITKDLPKGCPKFELSLPKNP